MIDVSDDHLCTIPFLLGCRSLDCVVDLFSLSLSLFSFRFLLTSIGALFVERLANFPEPRIEGEGVFLDSSQRSAAGFAGRAARLFKEREEEEADVMSL